MLNPELRGTMRVLGGPGTGKSALLIDVAAARIRAGADPESVLLLTGSGRISTHARSALTAKLLGCQDGGVRPAVVREPLVRSVHSYAFAVLRLAAQRAGGPPPRLVTSAEQDAIIAELLAGEIADGPDPSAPWPAELRAALGTAGFAAELRELLTRCAERGVEPQQLERLGRLSGRREWAAAGRFARNYEQVMLLRAAVGTVAPQATTPAVGAAELVGAALEAFAVDPELLASQRARIGVLLVDDAQQLDPQAALLVRVLAAGAELTLIAGDQDQAVFGFRGGEPAALLDEGTPSITLRTSHRCAPAVARAVAGIAGRLPGGGGIEGTGDDPGSVMVQLAASATAEAAMIADFLRRAHLVDGVPWSQMAVIVRSVPRAAAGATSSAGAGRCSGGSVGVHRFAGRAARGAGLADSAGRDRRRAGRRTGVGVVDRSDRSGRPGVAAPAAKVAASRRHRRAAKGIRRSAGRGAERRLVGPAGRGPSQTAASGPGRVGRRRKLAPARRRSALHTVGGMAAVGSATPLADGV